MRYSGQIYDGPLEGEFTERDVPEFLCDIGEAFSAWRCRYIWSRHIRAWVFDWTTAPQAKIEEPKRKRHIGRVKA